MRHVRATVMALLTAAAVAGCTTPTGSTQSAPGSPVAVAPTTGATSPGAGAPTSVLGVACAPRATSPSGMPVIGLTHLPSQAVSTLRLIARHGPFPFHEDDTIFDNYQKLLPIEPYGYYHEFTVVTPGAGNRGTRRIVAGSDGEDYYTADHYTSFEWISCGG